MHSAFALKALAKLPASRGVIYRGTGQTPEKIPKVGDVVPVTAVQSWSQSSDAASAFAAMSQRGEKSVVYKLNTTKAKNINLLKGAEGAAVEPEWVLVPGNSYRVTDVQADQRMFGMPRVTLVVCEEVS